MTRLARILLTALFLSMIARALHAGNKKLPVPSDADQVKTMKIVKEIYWAEYDNAKSLADKQALAKKLMEDAKNTKDDMTARYVMLKLSKDVATLGLDGLAAFAAVDSIAETFEIDPVVMKTAVLKYGAAHAKLPQHHKRLMEAGLFLVDAAVAEDNYSVAKQLCDFAADEAAAANDSDSRTLSIKRGGEVETVLAKLYEKAQSASPMLNADPISPEANAAVGKYLCYVKGDWERGILMLALGSDRDLKTLAEKELESPPNRLALGDGWWDRAGKEDGIVGKQSRARAAHWYHESLPELSGLEKVRVQKRAESVSVQQASPLVAEQPAPIASKLPEHTNWTIRVVTTQQVQRTKTVTEVNPRGGVNERQIPYMENVRHYVSKTVHATLVNYDYKTGTVVLRSIFDRDPKKGEKEEVRSFRYVALGVEDKKYLDEVKKELLKQKQ